MEALDELVNGDRQAFVHPHCNTSDSPITTRDRTRSTLTLVLQVEVTRVLRRPVALMAGLLAGATALGTLGLLAGPATSSGFETSFTDALFTSASAATSTGLTVVDTATHWSLFGKAIIALLFELSALAVSFIASAALLVLFPKLGVRRRICTLGADGAVADLDLKQLAVVVVAVSMALQLLAAFALTLRFWIVGEFGFSFALRHGVFGAMSAFANAGFTLNSNSMMQFANDWWVSVVVMLAALAGTLGVPLLLDVLDNRRSITEWTSHTRAGLLGTGALVIGGAAAFLGLEWSNGETLGPINLANKLLVGTYQSVMARGTGFSSVKPAAFDEATSLVADFLMVVGGTAGSTGGGATVTALVIVGAAAWANSRRGRDAGLENFVPTVALRAAVTSFAVALVTVLVATTVLLRASDNLTVGRALFEACSAFGTTGWSQGVTPALDTVGRLTIIVTMFIGRLIPLAFVASLLQGRRPIEALQRSDAP